MLIQNVGPRNMGPLAGPMLQNRGPMFRNLAHGFLAGEAAPLVIALMANKFLSELSRLPQHRQSLEGAADRGTGQTTSSDPRRE